MPRRPAVELSAYELQREETIAKNLSQLISLGLVDPPAPPAAKMPYTKTADKVQPREPSRRPTQAPARLLDEISNGLFDENVDVCAFAKQLVEEKGSNPQLCFCGQEEDDDSARYVPCFQCNRVCHFSCAGIQVDDDEECMLRIYTCPDCEMAKELEQMTKKLQPKRERKPLPSPPVVAVRKPLVAVNISISGGVVNLGVASNILPKAYPVRKDLTMDISACVEAANQHIQPRLRFDDDDTIHSVMKMAATQAVCINSECDGTIAMLGGGTMTPKGQKYRYQCRLCGKDWQQFPPDKCPDRNFEITTKKYNRQPGAKNKRKHEVNYCRRCKVPRKGHKCGQAPELPLPMPTQQPTEPDDDDLPALLEI